MTSVTSSLDFPTIELKLLRCKLCSFGRQQKVVLECRELALALAALTLHLADMGREAWAAWLSGGALGVGLARAEKG